MVLCAAVVFAACQDAPKADNAATSEKKDAASTAGAAYTIDTATSSVGFVGTAATGQHNGVLKFSSGSLAVDNGQVTGGSFVINIASLENKDLSGDDKGKLEGHLKSPDFFDLQKFPTAKFEITKVEPFDSSKGQSLQPGATHLISGNLTLKDSTKNVSFPAKITVTGTDVTAQSQFNIDRTLWGLNYKGPNNPADWIIKKEVNLTLDLKAKK